MSRRSDPFTKFAKSQVKKSWKMATRGTSRRRSTRQHDPDPLGRITIFNVWYMLPAYVVLLIQEKW